jgi:hypothetical protein
MTGPWEAKSDGLGFWYCVNRRPRVPETIHCRCEEHAKLMARALNRLEETFNK